MVWGIGECSEAKEHLMYGHTSMRTDHIHCTNFGRATGQHSLVSFYLCWEHNPYDQQWLVADLGVSLVCLEKRASLCWGCALHTRTAKTFFDKALNSVSHDCAPWTVVLQCFRNEWSYLYNNCTLLSHLGDTDIDTVRKRIEQKCHHSSKCCMGQAWGKLPSSVV